MTPTQNSNQSTGPELTIYDHIRSLRRTVFSVVFVILAASGIIHAFKDTILNFLLAPLGTPAPELQFLSPLDPLYFIIKVDFVLGFLLSLPITIFLVWRFVSPGSGRRSIVTPLWIIAASSALSLVAATYAYKLLIPIILNYMSDLVVPGTALSFTANGYLDFFLSTTSILILVFQIPLLIVGLTYAGIIEPAHINRNRPYIYVGIIILTAILTPTTDLVSLALIAVPALGVVEFGTLLSYIIHQRRLRKTNGSLSSQRWINLALLLVYTALAVCVALLFFSDSITLFSTTSVLPH